MSSRKTKIRPLRRAAGIFLSLATAMTAYAGFGIVDSSPVSMNVNAAYDYGLVDTCQEGVILHAWQWSFNNIKANMQKIAEAGYTSIQTSVIQQAKESTKGKTNSMWWVYYQPANFTIDESMLLRTILEISQHMISRMLFRLISGTMHHAGIQQTLIKPTSATPYNILIKAKDSAGNIASVTFKVTVTADENSTLTNTSSLSVKSASVGDTINVKFSASGGTGTKVYEAGYKSSTSSSYTKLRDYSTYTSANLKLITAGKYTIYVFAKDENGSIAKKYITITAK